MSSLWKKLPGFAQRRLARWFGRQPWRVESECPIVSFTFDDFPRSAVSHGASILNDRGYRGTYYVSYGLMNEQAPTGRIFAREDLDHLICQGHELGCHTFDHYDSWQTDPGEFEASCLRNQARIAAELPGVKMKSFSYPISWPRPETKRRIGRHYECARGAGQTYNVGTTDLNYLKAFFIEQSRENFEAIREVINANAGQNGWLIFATHDVCDSPTRFGCTAQLFEKVVACVEQSGAVVLPVWAALRRMGGLPCPAPVPARESRRREPECPIA
jgi:peptidoglycan/xylan/chitin deacetylase (PgdA/CDA1 family)